MMIALRSRRSATVLPLALIAAVGTLVVANPARAQEDQTGASADKDCPGMLATLGQTVTCNFTVANIGAFPAVVTGLTEQSPAPGGAVVDISCTAGGAVIAEGATLAPGTPCAGTFQVTVANNPALCNTLVVDRVDIALQYSQFDPPLTAGTFATHVTGIVCPSEITISKTTDELSKVGDSITYTFEICNVGDVTVNRGTVIDTLLGDISTFFPATLTPGECVVVERTRPVAAGDPDPLGNTVTATYTSGSGIFAELGHGDGQCQHRAVPAGCRCHQELHA